MVGILGAFSVVGKPTLLQATRGEGGKPGGGSGGPSFVSVLDRVRATFNDLGELRTKEVLGARKEVEAALASGTKLDPAKLFLFQQKASDFGLRVEMLSKVAEAGLATLRKLQTSN